MIDSWALESVVSGDVLHYTNYQRTVNLGHRADYGGSLDTSSLFGFIKTFPIIFLLYMFAPFPWQIGNLMDIYAFIESLIRLVMIFGALRLWQKQKGEVKSQSTFLLICFLTMEVLWSLGTKNWGTAIRHHLVAYPILVLVGGYQFWSILNLFIPRRLIRQK